MTALGLLAYYRRKVERLTRLWRLYPPVLKHIAEQEGEAFWTFAGMDGRATKAHMQQNWARTRRVMEDVFRRSLGWTPAGNSGIEWIFEDAA